ncbi:TonB-dependent receptor [Sphingosinicella rhizophila]|uniref:TonB-dependent receptor n=1 Tax=Sphingosinicella rhizophila TaxID=3050082 RepID=A0ABU3Q9T2_9SPHN|nr:TonB-dependent receptor [Sphingosinicella sp. GR2756]MDT9600171.1 TonB-dependent receptor [Sphingosinicella sp. GR2756]
MANRVGRFRHAALAATGAMAIMCAAAPAAAQTRMFDVPAQRAATAVSALARQAGVQILLPGRTGGNVRTQAVRGNLSVEQALDAMLAGTGLRAMKTGPQTYTILRAAGASATDAGTVSAQAQDIVSADVERDEGQDIVVTGSRLRSQGEQPVTVFNEKRIDELGVNQVADVLRYLPQQSFQTSEATSFGAARSVQLRGLGLGTTLVLVNGRRTVTSALQGTRNVFDLNMLPLAAVERIEVLTESASSVYGADAIGGVLNLILKDEVDRPTADFSYGTAKGGGAEYQGSLAFSVPAGRLRNVFVLEYFKREPLFGRDRDYTRDADFRRFGGTDQRVENANPGNICAADFSNLPGLPGPCAAVPVGSTGVGLTPEDFAQTVGQTNLASSYADLSIIPAGRRYSAFARAEFDLSSAITAFGELMYVDREDHHIQPAPSLDFTYVPETNAFNPFSVPVLVNYRFDTEAYGPRFDRYTSKAWRIVGGLEGNFDKGGWETAFLYTHDKGRNIAEGGLDLAALDTALAESDPTKAFNPFQDGPGGSPALLASLRRATPIVDSLVSEAVQGSAFVRRELFALPGGAAEAVVGGELRNESVGVHSQIFGIDLAADRDTASAFFELRAPLIGPDQDSPLGERLTITASGRFDHYSDFGGTLNPRIGALWAPTKSFLVRGSYGTSFRAPSLFELFLPPTFIPGIPLPDARRGGEISLVDITLSGNPNLDPEKARSFNAGFVFTPASAAGLSLGATYWSVEQDQRVVLTDLFLILQNEEAFPNLVVRAAPTPADVAAGRPGRLQALNVQNINSGKVETSGMDFDVSFGIDTSIGRFAPSLTATWVHSYKAADFPFFPSTERVGLAQPDGTIPDWRAVGTLTWSRRGFGATASARYVSPYDDIDFSGERTGRKIEPPIVIDFQLSFNLGEIAKADGGLLEGFLVRAGAINLFDADPPFSEVRDAYGHDASQSEIRGRFLYLKLTKAF